MKRHVKLGVWRDGKRWWAAAVLIGIVAILLFGMLLIKLADAKLREELLNNTRMIAQAINPNTVKAFNGTEADAQSHEFRQFQTQLMAVRQASSKCRFLYLLGRRMDGELYFIVDSEAATSRDYSPPGQLYIEAPARYGYVFARQAADVIGPYHDRWGTWVTALVPIVDPQTTLLDLAAPQDAVALVNQARQYYIKYGKESLLAELNKPQGMFNRRDLYAFAYDLKMNLLAHPIQPDLIGRNLLDEPDLFGNKLFRREILQIATTKGTGWVDYEYKNPVNKQTEPKSTYIQLVDDLIVCAGVYGGKGTTLAVLGMDVDSSTWNAMLFQAALPPLVLLALLITISLCGHWIAARCRHFHWGRGSNNWHTEQVFAAIIGILLTALWVWLVHDHETQGRRRAFWKLAESRTDIISETIQRLHDTELEGLARFIEGSDKVTLTEFQHFTDFLILNPVVQAWEWIPAVPVKDLPSYEAEASREGLPGFPRLGTDGSSLQTQDAGLAVCYPLVMVASSNPNNENPGFVEQLAPQHMALFDEALRTQTDTASEPFQLVGDSNQQLGVLVCKPVYKNNNPSRHLGFVAAILRIGTLLNKAVVDDSLQLEISQLKPAGQTLFLSSASTGRIKANPRFSIARPCLLSDKVYRITCWPDHNFTHLYPARAGWLSAVAGTILTAIIVLLVGNIMRRREILERLVSERTLELSLSQARYYQLAQHSRTIVWEINADYTYTYISDVVEAVLGYTPSDVAGAKHFSDLHPAIQDASSPAYLDLGRGEPFTNVINVSRNSSGGQIWLSTNGIPLLNENGSLIGYRGSDTDISERVRAEEERQKLEVQLRQTQKLEAIGTLAGGIAHDFNNITFAILGNADLAAESIPENHPAREYIEEITTASHRAVDLIKQILTFARRTEKKREPVRVLSTLNEVDKMLRAMLPSTILISTHIDIDNNTSIMGDPAELHQVVLNLCINAGQAMMAQGGALDISLAWIECDELLQVQYPGLHDGYYVKLTIADTGPGMPPEVLERIFEPFFTTKSEKGGTGLGLAVVDSIVKELGGLIHVYSVVGRGTSFNIFLPAACTQATGSSEQPAVVRHGVESILLVDDEPALVRMLRQILEGLGYSVHSYTSSEAALEAYLETPGDYDLVITDQTMPGLTGTELAKRVFAVNPRQPVILISGFSQTIPVEQVPQDGIAAYLSKPISKRDLARIVRQVLD